MSSSRATGARPSGAAGGGSRRPGRDDDVVSITSAPEPLADDQARRTRRYLLQMGIRLVCFVGAILVDGWVRWALVVAAVVLPYVAVLFANAGRDRVSYDTSPLERRALPPGGPRTSGPGPVGPGDPTDGAPGPTDRPSPAAPGTPDGPGTTPSTTPSTEDRTDG